MKMNIPGLDSYSLRISRMMIDLDYEMSLLPENTDQYKDRQYFQALLDIVYGATEPFTSKSRLKNLKETQKLIKKLEIME